jgi:AcrR family transcriptional regulator
MNSSEDQTREKIILSALTLFSQRGIKKTSLNEVAYHAGVTRVTIYRHFSNKKELVRAAHLRVERVFQKALGELEQNPQDWESVLNQTGEDLSALPSGDVFARSDEIKRLYPDVYRSIHEMRAATLSDIFEHVSAIAERQGLLRPGLNRSIFQAVFWELVINLFDNPRFKAVKLSDAELYYAIKDILLHGILRS